MSTQHNTAERKKMLRIRRRRQLARTGGEYFIPSVTKKSYGGIIGKSKRGTPFSSIIEFLNEAYCRVERMHATKGPRPLTAFEKSQMAKAYSTQ